MNKVLLTLFFSFMFFNTGFAESYYFKECKLSENAFGDYIIDFDKNLIKVTLKATSGATQKLNDKIKLVTKDQIISDIIQNKTKQEYYLQYNLDVTSKFINQEKILSR